VAELAKSEKNGTSPNLRWRLTGLRKRQRQQPSKLRQLLSAMPTTSNQPSQPASELSNRDACTSLQSSPTQFD